MTGTSTHAIPTDVTLAILAGGLGSRMGMAKALLAIDGRPILDYLLDRLAWPGRTMLVTAPGREHPPGSKRFSLEASDPVPGGGPLRGILTALEHLTSPLLVVLTVDMPGIRLAQCMPLLDHLRENPHAQGIMWRRATNGSMQLETFPCALRSTAKAVIAHRLTHEQRSVHGLLEEAGFLSIEAPGDWDTKVWANLNHPSDVVKFAP